MLLGIISDIHEDIENLEKAINFLTSAPCDKILCLGDIIGYNTQYFDNTITRDIHSCISRIKDDCDTTVTGNHDLSVIHKIPHFDRVFDYPLNWYQLGLEERQKLGGGKIWIEEEQALCLSDIDLAFMGQLPEYHIERCPGFNMLISHYAFPNLSGSGTTFIEKALQLKNHFCWMHKHQCKISVSGHRHVEGCIIATKDKFRSYPFGSFPIPEKPCWLDGPCIVSGKKQNGFLMLDTDNWKLEVIAMKNL